MTKIEQAPRERPSGSNQVSQAVASARVGRPGLAHRLLIQRAGQKPDDDQVWLDLASLSENPRQARSYLRQALRINPHNRRAIRGLRRIDAEVAPAKIARPASHDMVPDSVHQSQARILRRWLGIWLLVGAAVVVLGGFVAQARPVKDSRSLPSAYRLTPTLSPSATPTLTAIPTLSVPERIAEQLPDLQHAWEARDWSRAASLLIDVYLLDPDYPGLRAARCDTYLHWAFDLENQGQIEKALTIYRRALPLCDDSAIVQEKNRLALRYLSGKWKYDHEYWDKAVATLQQVYDTNPDYAETSSLLYASYLAWSQALVAENHPLQAQDACEAALKLQPDSEEAKVLLDRIRVMLASRKRVEVNITKQRMYVWQGDTLIYDWVCSTGEPGRGTAAGHYRILDKIPEAWASTWSLRMPYWLGIYWAGSMENGIHALPILSNGQTLWAGYLGTPVSYGCVILSVENARTLYHWVDIGTPVWIHY